MPPDEDSGFTYFSTLNEMPPVTQLLHSYGAAANFFGFLLNLHPAESDDSQARCSKFQCSCNAHQDAGTLPWLVILCVLKCVNVTPHAAALLLPPARPLCTLTLY